MKITTTLLLSILFITTGFTQEIMYDVRGANAKPIKKDQLINATTLIDIKGDYPSSWITQYEKVEIRTSSNGIHLSSVSKNDTLTQEQKEILSFATVGTDIEFDVFHLYNNSVTGAPEPRTVHFSYTVIPDVEAEYYGGEVELNAFLKEKAINNIPENKVKGFDQAVVAFTVNEKGTINNAYMEKSSGDEAIDKMLLSAINKMPKWKPAETIEGVKVKQQFRFSVGYPGC